MAMDAIKKVTQTEQDSQKRRDMVAAECKQQVADAQKAGRKLLEDSRTQAEAQVRQMMEQAEEAAAQESAKIMAGAQQDCEALKHSAQQRLEKAATLIVEKVVKG